MNAINQKIEKLEAARCNLMNSMTCRTVRYDLERNTQELAFATGFDRRTVEAIYRPGSWMIRHEEAQRARNAAN